MPSSRRTFRQLLSPIRLVVLSFGAVILVGTMLLLLPVASADGAPLSFIDALFTATTSVCVTGLVVVDTGTHFSRAGQAIILCLIQLGGLGYMTLAMMLAVMLGRRVRVSQQLVARESLGQFGLHEFVPLLRRALLFTLTVEGAGAVAYLTLFHRDLPLPLSAWHACFHSVSAFCNAGLDLFGERFSPYCSLEPLRHQPEVVLLTAGQIILGGIGFLVVNDLLTAGGRRLSLHTRVVLATSLCLLVLGTATVFVLERRDVGVLSTLPVDRQLLQSFFLSVTSRTAGFSTVPVARLHDATLVFLCFLMFVGGSPGGTAGGIKTTTLAVVLVAVWATIRGDDTANLFERSLTHTLVYRALTLFVVGVGIVFLCTVLLLILEEASLESPSALHSAGLYVFFEATSAFGTVGLSTGITPQLTTMGKLILIVTMFLGRIGPVSLAAALAARERPSHIRYPQGRLPLG